MELHEMILPLRLQPLLSLDDETILSDSIPNRYLARQIGLYWYQEMEEIHPNVPFGTRLLIRRDTRNGVTTDHITTHVSRDTCYGNWTHQTVIYRVNELSPYPFDMDCFNSRLDLMAIYRNQHPIQHEGELPDSFPRLVRLSNREGVPAPLMINPLPEGESMWVDEDELPMIFPLSPIEGVRRLGSNALLSNRNS
jgi:hypothetical protein